MEVGKDRYLIWFIWMLSRLRLHEGKVIKDRRHHLRTYPNCFVAKEIIDWLIEHKEASERETAIKIMQKLLDQSIIHHGRFVHHTTHRDDMSLSGLVPYIKFDQSWICTPECSCKGSVSPKKGLPFLCGQQNYIFYKNTLAIGTTLKLKRMETGGVKNQRKK